VVKEKRVGQLALSVDNRLFALFAAHAAVSSRLSMKPLPGEKEPTIQQRNKCFNGWNCIIFLGRETGQNRANCSKRSNKTLAHQRAAEQTDSACWTRCA